MNSSENTGTTQKTHSEVPASYYLQSLKYYWYRYFLRRTHLTAHAQQLNSKFRFKIEDGGGKCIYKRGMYEPLASNFLMEYLTQGHLNLKDGDIILDVGANLGWYSIMLSKFAPPGTTIYAFEPVLSNYQLLCENLKLNDVKNVIPVQKAVGNALSEMEMHLYPDKNTGRHSLLPVNNGQTITVDVTTLDDFLGEQEIDPARVKFLKIDVEGYEYPVLQGAQKVLSATPTLLCEYCPSFLETANLGLTELFDLLHQSGYHGYEIKENDLKPIHVPDLVKLERWTDIFWKAA